MLGEEGDAARPDRTERSGGSLGLPLVKPAIGRREGFRTLPRQAGDHEIRGGHGPQAVLVLKEMNRGHGGRPRRLACGNGDDPRHVPPAPGAVIHADGSADLFDPGRLDAGLGMRVSVLVAMVVPAGAVSVIVAVIVLVTMVVIMGMVVMPMIVVGGVIVRGRLVRVVVVMVVAALTVVVGRLLRLEGALHRRGGAAGAAHQLGRAGGYVERVRADLGGNVLAAELPGEAQQPGRAAGADLEKRLLRRAHPDEAPILELERIAVLQPQGPLQGEVDGQSARRRQVGMRLRPGGVVEDHRIDDEIGPDGGLADDQASLG